MEVWPDGLSLVLKRHGRSRRNFKKVRSSLEDRVPVFLSESYEDRLTLEGKIEAALAARYLKRRLGRIDLVVCSTSNRSIESAKFVVKQNPRCDYMQIRELVEKSQGFGPEFLDSLIQGWIRREKEKNPEANVTLGHALQNLEVILPPFVSMVNEWQEEQQQLRISLRNLYLFGESAEELQARARYVLEVIRGHAVLRGARKISIDTHAKMLLAMRIVLEKLTYREQDYLCSVDGPPFPCNAGMTFYESRKGKLVRVGEECVIPDGLKVDPESKRLLISDLSRQEYARLVGEILADERREPGVKRRRYMNLEDMFNRTRIPISTFGHGNMSVSRRKKNVGRG